MSEQPPSSTSDGDRPAPLPLPDWVGHAEHRFGGGYLHVLDEVVVHAEDVGRFREEAGRRNADAGEELAGVSDNLRLLRMSLRDDQSVPQLVSELRGIETGPAQGTTTIRVWPHYAMVPTSHAQRVTVSAPKPAHPLTDITGSDLPGTGVTVLVLDSGLAERRPDWLGAGVRPVDPAVDLEPPVADGGRLDAHAGHGTFVAGVVRRHAPGATILVRRVLDAGVVTDRALAQALLETDDRVDLINLSLGGYVHDGLGLPETEAAIAQLRVRRPQLVVVAGAGNDGRTQPFFPAALGDVIGVAALDGETAAIFSNHGSWVDAAAQGVDVTSTFLTAHDVTPDPATPRNWFGEPDPGPTDFDGFARWSGTSVSAPAVTGAIAAAMRPGVDARAAAFLVTGSGVVQREPGLGAIVRPAIWG
jgi:hypothetical protein